MNSPAEVKMSLETCRANADRVLIGRNFQDMNRDDLRKLQSLAGLGHEWGLVVIAPELMAANRRAFSSRSIDLRLALSPDMDAHSGYGEQVIETILRVALACFLLTSTTAKSRRRKLSIGTWMKRSRVIVRLARNALEASQGQDICIPLTDERVKRALGSDNPSHLEGIIDLQKRGLIGTFPAFKSPQSNSVEKSRRNSDAPESAVDAKGEYQPLPDAFVAQLGWRCLWLSKILAPSALDCVEGVLNDSRSFGKSRITVGEIRQSYLSQFQWRTPSGDRICELPFQLISRKRDLWTQFKNGDWGIRTFQGLRELLGILQASNLFILLLAAGPRIGEMASLRSDCLLESSDRDLRIEGRTYKLVTRDGGELRDWPLAEELLPVLLVQQRLARIFKVLMPVNAHIEPDALWVPMRSGKSAKVRREDEEASYLTFNHSLRRLATVTGLMPLLGDSNPNPHRFRKTLARLIGLAISGAPKVLMDVFGHKSIEMALRYIHTDKDLRAEVEEVAKGQVVMFAKEAISSAKDNGGSAATRVRNAIDELRARRKDLEFGVDDVGELAVLLTLGGTQWQLVRPGVICTKLASERGPCTKKTGHPMPSSCRSNCGFRLELAALRDDVNRLIEEAVSHLQRAHEEKDEFAIALWEGQILTNLPRFEELREKWSTHPLIQQMVIRNAA